MAMERPGPREGPAPNATPLAAESRHEGRRAGARSGPATPAPRPSRRGSRRPPPRKRRKARMVHRVVRHVEVWSLTKVAAAFAACGYVIGLISGYLLWRAADRVGTIDGIEGFMEDSGGYDTFQIVGSVVFQSAAVGLAIVAALCVALAALGGLLFNLISDLTGGIRMTAIDEDLIVTPARRPAPPRRSPGETSPPLGATGTKAAESPANGHVRPDAPVSNPELAPDRLAAAPADRWPDAPTSDRAG